MATNFTPIDDLIKLSKQPSSSVSSYGVSKEMGPISSRIESNEYQEIVDHEPSKEVSEFVTPRSESIQLPPDLRDFGLEPVANPKFPGYQNVKLPLTDEKIIVGQKAPITSSIRWLSTLALYLLARAHLALKVVKGKVVRVIKN